MNTENTRPEEEVSPVNKIPQEASGEPTSEATSPVDSAGTTEAATESAAAAETPAESGEESAPRRKIQLNPVLPGASAMPIPSIGEGRPAAPMPTGPAEVPTDDEVTAAVAEAVGEGISTPADAAPASSEKKAPVDVPESETLDASMEAMLNDALSGQGATDGAASAPVDHSLSEIGRGTKLSGTVQAVNEENVLLDFGLRLSGCVPARQFNQKLPEIGATIDVVVDRVDDKEGLIFTNLPRGTSKVQGDWDSLQVGQVIECMVSKTNKGGLDVAVGNLRGFLPASQVDIGFVADLEPYVGQKLRVIVTEVKPQRRRLVVSRRQILAEEREVLRKELMENLKPEDVVTGRVKTIKEYGAFIDLGGSDGFLPVSQMSWARIGHPNELLQEGQEVEVKVLSIDHEKQRISLGMRQLEVNPWRLAEGKYPPGSKVTGRVTRTESFGAFVELEPGLEGLVHISELDYRRVQRVTEVLNVGEHAEVQVLEVQPSKKRISLSLKALKEKPEEPKDEDQAPGGGQGYERRHRPETLKGGTSGSSGGGLFGNPKDFS